MKVPNYFSKLPYYGKLLNISIFSTHFFMMLVFVNVIISLLAFAVGYVKLGVYGESQVINDIGIPYQKVENALANSGANAIFSDIGVGGKPVVVGLMSALNIQYQLKFNYVVVLLSVSLLLFFIARQMLVYKNRPFKPNTSQQETVKILLKSLESSLGVAPIALGRHTTFERHFLPSMFKPVTLVISMQDFLAAQMGKLSEVSYIVHHELCHKLSWDISLGYLIKLVAIFNALLLSILFVFISFAIMLAFVGGIPGYIKLTIVLGLGYLYFKGFSHNYFLFSMFKEHLADEFALSKINCLATATTALNGLEEEKSRLHPAKQKRIEFLCTGVSSYPLALFVHLNLIWCLGFALFNRGHMSVFIVNPWAELVFMTLNFPLILFILAKKNPPQTRFLASFAAAVLVILVLLPSGLENYMNTNYLSQSNTQFSTYLFNNLSWYHVWFALTLLLAQYPRKLS